MAKIRQRKFAVCLFCMNKPKPWRHYPSNIPGSLHGAVRYVKCLNASSLIFSNKPSTQPSQKKRKKRVTFPFLKKNLEKSVEMWDLYEARYNKWKSEHQQHASASSPSISSVKQLTAKRVTEKVNEQLPSPILPLVPIQKRDGSLNLSRSGRVIKPRLQTWQGERISYDVDGNPIAAHSVTTKAVDTPDYSPRLAAICDGVGIRRLEHSKQSHRPSITIFEPQYSNNKAKKKKKRVSTSSVKKAEQHGGRNGNWSSDDSEDTCSFLAEIDRVPLSSISSRSPSPAPSQQSDMILDYLVEEPTDAEEGGEEVDSNGVRDAGTDAELSPIPFKKRNTYRVIQSVVRPARNNKTRFKKCKIEQRRPAECKIEQQPTSDLFSSISTVKSKNMVVKIAETKIEPQKKKRWTANETEQLKIALKLVVNPKTDDDWEAVSVFLNGSHRTGHECREQAIKIKWKPPRNLDDSTNADQNSGTSMRPPSKEIDFFSSNLHQSGKNASLLDLDPDDSLLKLMSTPPDEPRFARKPFILRQVFNETAHCSHDSSSFLD